MKKIPSLFVRLFPDKRTVIVTPDVTPGCEWVIAGEGRATIKIDGTACMVRDGKLYKRFDRKRGKPAPDGWEPCEDAPDPVTGHWPGWVPVGDGPEDRWHRETFSEYRALCDGTYELVGPKVQGNPYRMLYHYLRPHGGGPAVDLPFVTIDSVRIWLETHKEEGIVWHHPDGRMCKVKRTDFGLPWPVKVES